MIVAPSLLFVVTFGLMLFHSPDFHFYSIDRVGLGLLIFVVILRVSVLRLPVQFGGPVTWSMLAMLLLAFSGGLAQGNEAETWSLFAAKWLVPYALFHLAALVFDDAASLRHFEIFTLIALAYLSLIAAFFLFDLKSLIFPRFILDEGLGIHADRARGPFLQAVANGVTLNLLGLIALDSFRRGRLRAVPALLLFTALPLAILATKTRAVWLSFAGSIAVLLFSSPSRRLRRLCVCLGGAGVLALVLFGLFADPNTTMGDRLEERSPVTFRLAVYEAGWQMFLQKPVTGWGATAMQSELSSRISEFHQEQFFFHNTYLEILVQYGLIGLALYAWIVIDLFRIGRRRDGIEFSPPGTLLDEPFRKLWPMLVGVYLVNGSLVVMNYQFVNGFLFTLAGMLAAQNRRSEYPQADRQYVFAS